MAIVPAPAQPHISATLNGPSIGILRAVVVPLGAKDILRTSRLGSSASKMRLVACASLCGAALQMHQRSQNIHNRGLHAVSDQRPTRRRRRQDLQSSSAWGRRNEGHKKAYPQFEQKQAPLRTLKRPMLQDFADVMNAGADVAMEKDHLPEELVQQVFVEAAVLTSKGKQRPTGQRVEQVRREIEEMLPTEQLPSKWPHFRKMPGLDPRTDGDTPAEHFFSHKTWDMVHGITDDMIDFTHRLRLLRPSRIQNLTYWDIVYGSHLVMADQAGSGKTLAYLLPLFKRYILDAVTDEQQSGSSRKPKIVVLTPTSDLADQNVRVARVLATRSLLDVRVVDCSGSQSSMEQREQLKSGADIVVATAGRLKWLLFEDYNSTLDLSECKAIVFDEVDLLVDDSVEITTDDLRRKIPDDAQWLFVTATLGAVTRSRLQEFGAEAFLKQPLLPGRSHRRRGLVWRTGPGLHRVSPNCEHVLVDCTPKDLKRFRPEEKLGKVMSHKMLALAWHLKYGVLRNAEDQRIVVFCNTIRNCQRLENYLRKNDPRDQRTGQRAWKALTLHSQRGDEMYEQITKEFDSQYLSARDYLKKKILICTDRLARGIDFGSRPIPWVVLLDWPRDATEYLRRAGRVGRGGNSGGVLSLLVGLHELAAAKEVTSAAIRDAPLEGGSLAFAGKHYVLELFDPTHRDWRAPEASAQRERKVDPDNEELATPDQITPEQITAPAQSDESWQRAAAWGPGDTTNDEGTDQEEHEDEWSPWSDEKLQVKMLGKDAEKAFLDYDDSDYFDKDMDAKSAAGVSLPD